MCPCVVCDPVVCDPVVCVPAWCVPVVCSGGEDHAEPVEGEGGGRGFKRLHGSLRSGHQGRIEYQTEKMRGGGITY